MLYTFARLFRHHGTRPRKPNLYRAHGVVVPKIKCPGMGSPVTFHHDESIGV